MVLDCKGGPKDLAQAKVLCEAARAQGHTGVNPTLDAINEAEAEQLAKEYADADAMMAQLLAEDEKEKAKSAAKSKKSAKKKKSASAAPPSGGATLAETAGA
jgi:Skp family chaperone for outer membrane proteins